MRSEIERLTRISRRVQIDFDNLFLSHNPNGRHVGRRTHVRVVVLCTYTHNAYSRSCDVYRDTTNRNFRSHHTSVQHAHVYKITTTTLRACVLIAFDIRSRNRKFVLSNILFSYTALDL